LFFVVLFERVGIGKAADPFFNYSEGVDVSAGKGPFYPRRPTLGERSVTSEQFSRSGGTEECQEVLNAVMVIVSCSTTEAARLKMGPSTRRAANFLKRGRLSILWPNAYLLDVLRT
jgi:hypothetical protein